MQLRDLLKEKTMKKVRAESKAAEARYLKDLGKRVRVTKITHNPDGTTITWATGR
jgi:hypothetical protein